MKFLELKIPPLAVLLLFALTMWATDFYFPSLNFSLIWSNRIFITFIIIGSVICIAGILEFRRSKTTVNPTTPNTASKLVTSGIYQHSRNPMYLGFLLMLIGWTAYLSHGLALVLLPLYLLYMNRFQIIPEEKTLSKVFNNEFMTYKRSVRRWI